jgi:tetratricopeptide (TPR) repeat protein
MPLAKRVCEGKGMPDFRRLLPISLLVFCPLSQGQEIHDHGIPEKLGRVSFQVSCAPEVHKDFERGIALLHSFAYTAAESAFRKVGEEDSRCAMAHWGMAMTYFHQLWDPPISAAALPLGEREIQRASEIGAGTERERRFIRALSFIFRDYATVPYRTRVLNYEEAMDELAASNKNDTECQVFYALSLLAAALPTDKTHLNQKRATSVLEPLWRRYPEHPGIAHYLIHAYDNAELAPRGVAAARAYSKIAPSAPHALHMPSHIFTRLGMWEDSITSNLAARAAAHKQGDLGEELHAMDYLVYAYLQSGRAEEAAEVIVQLKGIARPNNSDVKADYAVVAIPVRYIVERGQWADAASIAVPTGTAPHVAAIAVWARALGLARGGRPAEASAEIKKLRQIEQQLRTSENNYWATQTGVQVNEAAAWSAQAEGRPQEAIILMRKAADEEDAIEKLPVTPGPIIPAREQLGELLLEQNQPKLALKEFQVALRDAPGRRRALNGAARAAELSRGPEKADASALGVRRVIAAQRESRRIAAR